MSLNWQFTKEEVWEDLPKDDKNKAITDSLIWGTMITGLNEITEKNISEWIVRSHILSAVGWPLSRMSTDEGIVDWIPSREDLEARLGLSTNATRRTEAQFKTYVFDKLKRDAEEKRRTSILTKKQEK